MVRIKRLFRQPGFPVLLVGLYLLLFGWPFLSVPEPGSVEASYFGLFATWLSFIILLFFLGRT